MQEYSLILSNSLSNIFEYITAYVFFRGTLVPKKINRAIFFGGYLLAAVIRLLGWTFINPKSAGIFLFAVTVAVLAILMYDGERKEKTVVCLELIVAKIAAVVLVFFMMKWRTGLSVAAMYQDPFVVFKWIIFSMLAWNLLVMGIILWKKFRNGGYPIRYLLVICLTPAIFFVILYQIFLSFEGSFSLTFLLAVYSVLFVNLIESTMMELLRKQHESSLRIRLSQQQLRSQIEHYGKLIESRSKTMKFRHDMRNHFLTIRKLAEAGDIKTLCDYMDSINNAVTSVKKTYDTGHPVIDAVLSEKKSEADKSGIEIEFNVKLPPKIGIDNMDQCIILANALDNAIEACRRIKEGEMRRYITVGLSEYNGFFVLVVENTTSDMPQENRGIRDYKSEHGFGLSNIRDVVLKYDGNMKITHLDGKFILNIVLKMRSDTSAGETD